MPTEWDKIVVVTRKTGLEELLERFATKEQARFYLGEKLEVVSQMPQDGVIFSDGVEADYLAFDSGAVASISVAEEKARLVAA